MPDQPTQPVELAFPFKGLHEVSAVTGQPEGTTGTALNCRGYDGVARRDRGGQRPGLVRYLDPLEAAPVDAICSMTQSADTGAGIVGYVDVGTTPDDGRTTSGSSPASIQIAATVPFKVICGITFATTSAFAQLYLDATGLGDGLAIKIVANTGTDNITGTLAQGGGSNVFVASLGVSPPIGTLFHITIQVDVNDIIITSDVPGSTTNTITGYTFSLPGGAIAIRGNNGTSATNGVMSADVQEFFTGADPTLAPARQNRQWTEMGTLSVNSAAPTASADGVNDLAINLAMTLFFSNATDSVTVNLAPDTNPSSLGITLTLTPTPSGSNKWIHVSLGPTGTWDVDLGVTPPVGKAFTLNIDLRQKNGYFSSSLSNSTFTNEFNANDYDWLANAPQTVTVNGAFAKATGSAKMALSQTALLANAFSFTAPFATDKPGNQISPIGGSAVRFYDAKNLAMSGKPTNAASTSNDFYLTEAFVLGTQFALTVSGFIAKNFANENPIGGMHVGFTQLDDETGLDSNNGTATNLLSINKNTSGNHGVITIVSASTSQNFNIPATWNYGVFTLSLSVDSSGDLSVIFNGSSLGTFAGYGLLTAGIYSFNAGGTSVNRRISNLAVQTTARSFATTIETVLIAINGDLYMQTNGGGFTEIDTTPIGGGAAYAAGNEVSVIAAGGFFWLVDGTGTVKRVNGATGVMDQPAATGGTLPTGARLLVLYRDRIFYMRFLTDPFNYVASKSGDYLDFDASDTSPVGAFAGNNTQYAGLVGQVLTAAYAFGDSAMIMGMSNSIAVMRGDPKAGGSIDYLSRVVGIASPTAAAVDPDGALYFMSADGLYKISGEATNRLDLYGGVATATPAPVSRGRLDKTLGDINYAHTKVLMAWDPREIGLKIYLLPAVATAPTQVIFWDKRKDAFWPDQYPPGVGPTAIGVLNGQGGTDRKVVLGGWDGALRNVDLAATDDDGVTISSLVQFTPVQPAGNLSQTKLVSLRNVWGDGGPGGFNAVYSVLVGDDATEAVNAQPTTSNTITTGGYQALDRTRTRGGCLVIEISNDVAGCTWQIERMTASVMPGGRIRSQ